jgi:hypothetical protein
MCRRIYLFRCTLNYIARRATTPRRAERKNQTGWDNRRKFDCVPENGFDVVIRCGMRGGIDGKEEIISSEKMFGNCSAWREEKHVQNPIVNGDVRGRVRF